MLFKTLFLQRFEAMIFVEKSSSTIIFNSSNMLFLSKLILFAERYFNLLHVSIYYIRYFENGVDFRLYVIHTTLGYGNNYPRNE